MAPNHALSRTERIRREADYERVYARRCTVRDEILQICACENGLAHSRVGLSVGRRWGKANVRNRLRRLYREAFRLSKQQLPPGLDLVLIPRRSETTLLELMDSLPRLASEAAKRLQKKAK